MEHRWGTRGKGIEWREFGPPPVLALLDALEVPPSRQRATPIASRGQL